MSRVSPRWVTAGRTLERRHCLSGLHQHRVEATAASALPSDLHRQLDDRGGDLRQCLNALCPEFRFGHGRLSRFGFERCHGSSGAVRTVCVTANVRMPLPSLAGYIVIPMMDFDSVTRDWKWCGRYALGSIIEAGERLARTDTHRLHLRVPLSVASRLVMTRSLSGH